MPRRRTLKRYIDLFRNPFSLFGNGPDNGAVKTTLFPNGNKEIWCQTPDGLGVRIEVSNGPAGLGVTVRNFLFSSPLTCEGQDDTEFSIVQYRQDERSQAFKRWIQYVETPADIALLGPSYQRAREMEAILEGLGR